MPVRPLASHSIHFSLMSLTMVTWSPLATDSSRMERADFEFLTFDLRGMLPEIACYRLTRYNDHHKSDVTFHDVNYGLI